MKTKYLFRFLTIFIVAVIFFTVEVSFAQAPPQAFKYQSIVRNDDGNPMALPVISIRATVHAGAEAGPIEYQETHSVPTNQFGLVNLEIGNGIVVNGMSFLILYW